MHKWNREQQQAKADRQGERERAKLIQAMRDMSDRKWLTHVPTHDLGQFCYRLGLPWDGPREELIERIQAMIWRP
jgi:hypothetical protein